MPHASKWLQHRIFSGKRRSKMKQFVYTIRDKDGIHMRPAGMLVKKMKGFSSQVSLSRGPDSADLKKIYALMGLGVQQGEIVTVTADGQDEDMAIAAAELFFVEHL